MKTGPPILAALLVVVVVGGGVVLSSGAPADGPNANDPVAVDGELEPSPRVLGVAGGNVERTGVDVERANLGPLIELAAARSQRELETEAVVEHVRNASTVDERERRIRAGLDDIDRAELALENRTRSAVREHADGEITAGELLVRLAVIDAEAGALERRVDALEEETGNTPGVSVDDRAGRLRVRLDTHRGPIRSHVSGILRGDRPPDRLFVEVGGGTVMLSGIVDDEYVREATALDRRERGTAAGVDADEALNRTLESYPDVAATRDDSAVAAAGDTFSVTIEYGGGTLVAFVDGGSGLVYGEVHRQSLAAADSGDARSIVQSGLEVTVNRSFPGGPARVEVTAVDGGEPVSGATVSVDQQPLGETDGDGVLWFVSPRGEHTVTVVAGEANATVISIEPAETPLIAE